MEKGQFEVSIIISYAGYFHACLNACHEYREVTEGAKPVLSITTAGTKKTT